jgi:hypothetical protein
MKENRFSQADEDQMTRYLLGRLSEPERDAVRERLLAEPDYFECMQAVEKDLCDSFVRGELAGGDRAAMEKLAGESEYWGQRVRIARALTTALPVASPEYRGFRWLPWSIAAAAVAASMVLVHNNQILRRTVPPAPAVTPAVTRVVTQSVIAEWTLTQVNLRDSSQAPVFRANGDAKLVHLQLAANDLDAKAGYRAILRTAAGKTLFTQEPVSVAGLAVDLWIPATLLPRGAYEIALTAVPQGSATAPETAYAFRVEGP